MRKKDIGLLKHALGSLNLPMSTAQWMKLWELPFLHKCFQSYSTTCRFFESVSLSDILFGRYLLKCIHEITTMCIFFRFLWCLVHGSLNFFVRCIQWSHLWGAINNLVQTQNLDFAICRECGRTQPLCFRSNDPSSRRLWCKRATGFHRREKIFELNFFIGKKTFH